MRWLGSLLDSNEKELKRLRPLVERSNSLEPQLQGLSESQLRAKTDEFKERLAQGESQEELLPETFAAVREASRRTIGLRHFDVQLLGGIVLHQGKIAEMKTGEGKTLVATLPLYLNALRGEGCHLVTVNDYLAKRDTQWMGPIYHALGLRVGCIFQEASFIFDPERKSADPRWPYLHPVSRREAYQADITYGTNYEFGFDYLRDNMALDKSQRVQRPLQYAIVDEVDYILIDEARTPLIISGPAEEPTQRYYTFAQHVRRLISGEDYTIDEKYRSVAPTEAGLARLEKWLRGEGMLKSPSLYDPANHFLTYYLEAALKAQALYKRDRDYVVKDGQVIIVDEFTGRLMFGRRYAEGLHQAIEAKEGVRVQRESLTLASITYQNYFRMYSKIAGMTGTAATEAEEFQKIYELEVVVIPTHRSMVRTDHPDRVFKTEAGKYGAVAEEVARLYQEGRPVLVGTTSIEQNERLSELLARQGIRHQMLNAKHHEKEAAIIAQAGQPGAVTVATNMAGRGVDILLGEGVARQGGLCVLGTERHEARRVDNQLRGRTGRQGDPGESRFFISLEDDLVRRFGGDRFKGLMEWTGVDDATPLEHPWLSKAFEAAQVKMEAYNFDIRKHLLDYDDVLNKHREVIYGERNKILEGANLKANIQQMVAEELHQLVESSQPRGADGWDAEGLKQELSFIFPQPPPLSLQDSNPSAVEAELTEYAQRLYAQREGEMGPENMRVLERVVMLRTMDALWTEHLTRMEQSRQGIGLRAVGQTDPLIAYKKEGHNLFQGLLAGIRSGVVHTIFRVTLSQPSHPREREAAVVGKKVGRNDPCPCGSGKKYKKCHGK